MTELPGNTDRPEPLHALTSLRFFAALFVVFGHFTYYLQLPILPGVGTLLAESRLGVNLFFILSGFLLAYNYAPWFSEELALTGRFLWYRAARFMPLYLLALVAMTPISLATLGRLEPSIGLVDGPGLVVSWVLNALMLQAVEPLPGLTLIWNEPAWVVSAAMVFYLLFPFLMRFVIIPCAERGLLPALALLFWLIQLGLLTQVAPLGQATRPEVTALLAQFDAFAFKSPLFRFWEFAMGAVAGTAVLRARQTTSELSDEGADSWLDSILLRHLLLGLVVAGLLGLALIPRFAPGNDLIHLAEWNWYLLPTPLWLLLLIVLGGGATAMSPWLEQRWLVGLGEASYALYILHWLPLTLLVELARTGQPPTLWLVALTLLGTFALALTGHYWIERPGCAWLRGRLSSAQPLLPEPSEPALPSPTEPASSVAPAFSAPLAFPVPPVPSVPPAFPVASAPSAPPAFPVAPAPSAPPDSSAPIGPSLPSLTTPYFQPLAGLALSLRSDQEARPLPSFEFRVIPEPPPQAIPALELRLIAERELQPSAEPSAPVIAESAAPVMVEPEARSIIEPELRPIVEPMSRPMAEPAT